MSVTARTRGQIEDEIAKAILRFEKEYVGRGPDSIRAYIVEDLVIVRERAFLTLAEQKLARSPDGVSLIRQLRQKLADNSRSLLCQIVQQVTQIQVLAVHTDMDIEREERILVFALAGNLEASLSRPSAVRHLREA